MEDVGWARSQFVRAVRAFADQAFVGSLRVYSAPRVIFATLRLWLQIAGGWLLILCGSPWLWPVGIVILIASQQHLANWLHESSHYNLFRTRTTNDRWANFFFGAPIGVSLDAYRANHLTHHNYLSSDRDRDRFVHATDWSGNKLIKETLLNLCCWYGIRVVLDKYLPALIRPSSEPSRTPDAASHLGRFEFIAAALFWNAGFLATCVAAGRWWAYFAFWFYPLFSVAQFINLVRTAAEHQPYGYPAATLRANALVRTTLPSPIERWMLYGANFNLHLEHHVWPYVPFFNLPRLHAHLRERGLYDRHPELLQRSSMAFLAKARRLARHKADVIPSAADD